MDWRFSLFILSQMGLLIGFAGSSPENGICTASFVADALKTAGKDGALNCFEFWFNRYQTLIAALIALSIAFFAWREARRQAKASEKQLVEIKKQTKLVFSQSASVKVSEIQKVIVKLENCESLIENLKSSIVEDIENSNQNAIVFINFEISCSNIGKRNIFERVATDDQRKQKNIAIDCLVKMVQVCCDRNIQVYEILERLDDISWLSTSDIQDSLNAFKNQLREYTNINQQFVKDCLWVYDGGNLLFAQDYAKIASDRIFTYHDELIAAEKIRFDYKVANYRRTLMIKSHKVFESIVG